MTFKFEKKKQKKKDSMYDVKKVKKISSFYMYAKLDRENFYRQSQILCKNFLSSFYMYETLDSDMICRQGQIVQEFYINIFNLWVLTFQIRIEKRTILKGTKNNVVIRQQFLCVQKFSLS
eukprot:TRINITY_DN2905_c0_g1_i14.p10 TRINITY_DN2905_c0_g1~~TRINITY_DN2905_c0_g1_i14.p10  ORF type:complete len:120 (-),score=6.55 TRINITY_DN2905_c0_g1_i14:1205-1564(-)